jgi:uncharacterized membrane protein
MTITDSSKTTTVEKSIDVDEPISMVYNQWTQFESFPQFMGGINKIDQIDDTHLHWDVSVGGVQRDFDAEIVEQHPEERIAWRSTDGKTHAGVVTFHKLDDDKTRIMVQMDWVPEGIAEKAGAALGVDDRQIQSDLNKFKELIENNGFESGSWRGDVERK